MKGQLVHQYDYVNFRTNLYNLKKSIEKNQKFADEDAAAYAHDKQVRPPKSISARGYPRYHNSEAERLLKIDIDNKVHEQDGFKPAALRETNDHYKAFPKKVFRDHLYQEQRDRTSKEYWIPVMKAKAKGKYYKKYLEECNNSDSDS